MKGSYHIIVQNRNLKYEFDVRRNLTIIQGDSATGKTTLVEMIRESHLDAKSGVTISCERPCRVLEGDLWREQISYIKDSIIFIDEGASFVETEEFATVAKGSSNYFVIVTRESLEMLPISVEEVYGIKSSGRYGTLAPVYHEMYRIYDFDKDLKLPITPEHILVEDSNSGYEFFGDIAEKNGMGCSTAGGKSNIFACLADANPEVEMLVIADGAAFASQMNRITALMRHNKKIYLYLPESFEWLLLSSEIIQDKELHAALENPSEYIDSIDYFSWERYFTALLVEKTKDGYLKYSKTKLNPNYLQKNIQEKVIAHIHGVKFEV